MNPFRAARSAALATGLLGALLLGVVGPSATASDLATLKDRAGSIAGSVSELEATMAALEADAAAIEKRIETTGRELAVIELDQQRAERAFDRAEARYVAHAVSAYKMGDSTELALFLGAQSLDDINAAAEVAAHMARSASASLLEIGEARADAERLRAEVETRKQGLVAAKASADAVATDLRTALEDRREQLAGLRNEIRTLENAARRAAEQAARRYNLSTSQALLDLLQPAGPSRGLPDGFVGTGVVIEGVASWYGPGFEGNLTANGDVFDSRLYTVASKELPFGTWLYVEHEGRGVVVLVNDRGPYVGDRILDLSHAAAQAIGISGIGWVRAEVILKV